MIIREQVTVISLEISDPDPDPNQNPLKYGGFFRSGFKLSQDQQPIKAKLNLKPPTNGSPNYEIV